MRRDVTGSLAALASMAVLTAAMLPLRSHLSIATSALVFVVPVVVGVVSGGFLAGVLSVIGGFLVYDFFFIPPYLTLDVGARENWAALVVYAVVMLPVARVVAGMNTARANASRRGIEIRELFELSGQLVEDKPLDELLDMIVTTLLDVFGARQVALLLPNGDQLEIVASAGAPLTDHDRNQVLPRPGELTSLDTYRSEPRGDLFALALIAAGRPIGLLVISGKQVSGHEREPLLLFANQIALAVERAQLREQALRTELTEEMERLARMLVAAVSHDLRAPLASIKASSSTLADTDFDISTDEVRGLATLIDGQVDRLAVLVTNLLDMSRVQAGVLRPRRTVIAPADFVLSVLRDLPLAPRVGAPVIELPDDLPPVDIDVVLIARVLTNLVENAVRHGPKNSPITIKGSFTGDQTIILSVSDHGPGVSTDRHSEIFGMFNRRDGDSGTGLGLAIAKAFVEAHGQRIWVEEAPGGGACFSFTLPVATLLPQEAERVPHPHH
jgi:two-component system sensor histidine kinase KdpD